MHYDNPAHESGVVDDSGVRLHFTADLSTRSLEATSLSLGDLSVSMPDIPNGGETLGGMKTKKG